MRKSLPSLIIDSAILLLFVMVVYVFTFSDTFSIMELPDSFYHLNTIFLSILIEALPFVLIGVIIAGIIQIFITEDQLKKWIPKNKYAAVFMSCVVGGLFPACECGIVPIVRRLIAKGVPIYAGIGFLLTGPLINPIVIFSTYMAFGNDLKIALLRMGIGFLIALVIGIIISLLFQSNQLKAHATTISSCQADTDNQSFLEKVGKTLLHAVDEFFDMGKYLIIGAFLAAFVQVYVSTNLLVSIGEGHVASLVVMMGLAYLLSLCSEADAFIGASFSNIFPQASILGFLIYGPMIDLKNTFMMLSVFKTRFVLIFVGIVTVTVFILISLLQGFI
ncbi:permease [Gracilibacillus salitolerans]|uniref:Permease n=1 Tax=Gracilibacillus salitolerans TaxID=2663022 RepID=A0A5Q2TII8_9BACI|nr:permease [Gracilibacillus salitolerans]QGH33780.1 permease [Gracilibacillus salitolerans]